MRQKNGIHSTRFHGLRALRKTVVAVSDYRRPEEQRALSTVAELIGRRPIDDVFDKRVEFSEEIRATLQEREGAGDEGGSGRAGASRDAG
jgi:hypothetical protein